jgi:hypothetical protein
MTVLAPAAPAEVDISSCLAADPFSLAEANINPLTGLSTDYLNHFNEPIMLLEMLPSMPECREDLVGWEPLDYHQHFARSHLKHRDLAIAAYDLAEPRARRRLDAVCEAMKVAVLTTKEVLAGDGSEAEMVATAMQAAESLKALVARASAAIHGQDIGGGEAASIEESQDAIDAILKP